MLSQYDYTISDDAHSLVKQHINELVSTKTANFANARTIRNYFELIITQQATRISSIANPSENDVQSIIIDDVQKIVIS